MPDLRVELRCIDQMEIQRILELAGEEGTSDHYTGKRSWTRFQTGMPCELTRDPKKPGEWFVSLHNVSGGGFACWSKVRLVGRERIFLREFSAESAGLWVPAIVCHCTAGLRGYLIGASFENALNSEGSSAHAGCDGQTAGEPGESIETANVAAPAAPPKAPPRTLRQLIPGFRK